MKLVALLSVLVLVAGNRRHNELVSDEDVALLDTSSETADRDTNRPETRFPAAATQQRCDVSGTWYNELGSELYLEVSDDGKLTGEYRTAVESDCGSAGTTHSTVQGSVQGALMTFHVMWNGGKSVTTWTGQCHMDCDLGFVNYKGRSRAALHTMWLMTNLEESCDDHWSQQRIGHNVFLRKPIHPRNGRGRSKGKHVPDRSSCADGQQTM